jgi:hypothetical protein
MLNAGKAYNYIISIPEAQYYGEAWLLLNSLISFRTCSAEGSLAEPVFNDLFRYRSIHSSGVALSLENVAYNVKVRRNLAAPRTFQWLGFVHRLTQLVQSNIGGAILRSVTADEFKSRLIDEFVQRMVFSPEAIQKREKSQKRDSNQIDRAKTFLARPDLMEKLKQLIEDPHDPEKYPMIRTRIAEPRAAHIVVINTSGMRGNFCGLNLSIFNVGKSVCMNRR